MGEDQDEQPAAQQDKPQEPQNKWGDPISEGRQAELLGMLAAWDAPSADHGDRKGPFDGVQLSGAEVSWLAEQMRTKYGSLHHLHLEKADLGGAALQGADLTSAQLQGADLHGAVLQGATLSGATLQGATLRAAHLQGAYLGAAQLQGAHLTWARLQGAFLSDAQLQKADLGGAGLQNATLRGAALQEAILSGAQMEGADLTSAHLQNATLRGAALQGANLTAAQLQGADLHEATLQGATLGAAHLQGADLTRAQLGRAVLRGATLDDKTDVSGAVIVSPHRLLVRLLGRPRYGPALGDIHWGTFDQVQLTQLVGWHSIDRLTDERGLSWRSSSDKYRAAVRAYRQITQRLRDQGYGDVADRLASRAQVVNRKLLFRQLLEDWRGPWRLPRDLLRWLFSWFLALLAGYGYHPGRSVFWYLATIFGFAFAYYHLGPGENVPLSPLGSIVFSLTSFHGRGFFPGGSPGHTLTLDDPVTVLAALEAVLGLLIEISFIATFTQRFFGAK